MSNLLTARNTVARLPGVGNLTARLAGEPFGDVDRIAKIQGIFGADLIGFYPGGEPVGVTAAIDYSPYQYHGTYVNVVLGQNGPGDGQTCPRYDGTTSLTQPPAGFRSAFNSQEGTALCCIRNNIAWSDATARGFVRLMVDANNLVALQKDNANVVNFYYIAGGTTKVVSRPTTETVWFALGITWSKSAPPTGEMKAYFGGLQTGVTQTGLGVWVGTPTATNTVFGALSATPVGVWDGWEAYIAIAKRAATPAEMAEASAI